MQVANGHLTVRCCSDPIRTRNNVFPPTKEGKQKPTQKPAQALQQLHLQPHAAGQTQARRSQQLVVQADQLMSAAAGRRAPRCCCMFCRGGEAADSGGLEHVSCCCRIGQEYSGA